ncbi:MAG: FecR domain-containing protein [Bacteroidota bacterium]
MKQRNNRAEETNELIEKFSEGRCNQEEAREAVRLLKESAFNPSLYSVLSKRWYRHLETEEHTIEANHLDSTLDEIHRTIHNDRAHEVRELHRRIKWSKKMLRAAAVLLLPFLTISILYLNDKAGISSKKVAYTEVSVSKGSRLHTVLPDGTEVWINSGSTLRYPQSFSKKQRTATLSGEAYFNVVSDRSHPFVVKTEALDIRVTGTRFNVMAYPGDNYISATLEEGKIAIEKPNAKGEGSQLVSMKPMERMVFHKESKVIGKSLVKTDQFTSWKEGKLIFRNNTLDYIICRLERWYNTGIEISTDGTLPQTPFTMTIRDENIEQILEYLSVASGITYETAPPKRLETGEISKRRYIIRNVE